MKRKNLFALWGGFFIVCAGLGFIPNPSGILQAILTLCALGFFVPGGLLLYLAKREKDAHTLALIRNLSAASLVLTLGLLVLNFLTALKSAALGNVLHWILVIVSSPMVCSGYWALSLFLWACLLVASAKALAVNNA